MSPEEPGGTAGSGRRVCGRVLIIEDEALVAMDLQLLLEDLGAEVCGIAARQRQAVELARRTEPELLLADVKLAEGDSGIEAVREILQTRDIPVIFVTAFPDRLFARQSVEPAAILTKPYDPGALKATVERVLGGAREDR